MARLWKSLPDEVTMTNLKSSFLVLMAVLVVVTAGISLQAVAQQPLAPGRTRFDVTHYRIEAELQPAEHFLRAVGDVTFTPLDPTRSVVFELNGSLKVEAIERNGKPLTSFVQDAAGYDTTGPSVRIDLGEVVPANQPVTLRFRWSGALVTPEGGPLATKRLAYIGPEGSYLLYAARWFPFHDYAADRATADITITAPAGIEIVGYSDEPTTQLSSEGSLNASGGPSSTAVRSASRQPAPAPARASGNVVRRRFVNREPTLIGNIAAGRYVARNLRFGNYDVQFYVQPGSEGRIENYGEVIGNALQFYTRQYGSPAFGTRFVVAQIDDASLDAYAAPGMQFLSARFFDPSRQMGLEERIQRETAFQWWGLTVGLKSFDDAWLSQGLAEWSAFALRETRLSGGALEAAQRDMQERALMFENTASILRAPATLDDTSAAYQAIVFYKGAIVFRMLRETMGKEKFDELLRRFLTQYRGKNTSIDEFERLATATNGDNLRYFFARWVESTGAPEFTADYQIIRTRAGKFRARGTVKQNFENLRLPVEISLRSEGSDEVKTTTLFIQDKSEDFDFEASGKPLEVVIDPNNKVLRTSEDLRIAVVARRGLELFREGQYLEAQRQLEEALKLDKSNSWVYYNLGLLFLEQRNYQQALDNFQAALDGTLRPSWIEVWARIKRGNAYDAQGDRARAVNEYKKAADSGIDYDNAQQAVKQFLATPYDPRAAEQAATGSND
ncbi:MAG: tetratricopeptide repeat protein [Pyrinomonadaceae bacterium]|nr:tetratricopeptide repeat protein [Pyrinomonadaceae bacterium]